MRCRRSCGQASVELLALVPVLVGVVLLVWQLGILVRGALLAQERVRAAALAPAGHGGLVRVDRTVALPVIVPGVGELSVPARGLVRAP
jgi:hypothetical protein